MRFLFALVALSACSAAGGDLGDGLGDDGPADVPAAADPLQAEPLDASGYLHAFNSALDPYCGAVLIAPALAVTAGHCVEGSPREWLSIGFGEVGSGPLIPIEEIWVSEQFGALRAVEDDVAVLFLGEQAPPSVMPAPVARTPAPAGAGVRSVSYAYVPVGHTGERRVVTGDVSESGARVVVRFAGEQPNCHGDSGAGLFDADGTFLGIASGGSSGAETECFDAFHFAGADHSLDLLDAASDEADRRHGDPVF